MKNNNSLSINRLLHIISETGGICFKKDLPPVLAFSASDTSRMSDKSKIANASNLISRAISKEYLFEVNKTANNIPYNYIYITNKGIRHYCELNDLTELEYKEKFYISPRPFTSNALLEVLLYARVKLALYATGVVVNPNARPPLEELFGSTHKDSPLLASGIYYTDKEYRAAIEKIETGSEQFSSTKFYGLLIKGDKILVIFVKNPKTRNMLSIRPLDIIQMKTRLAKLKSIIPNAFSFIGGFEDKEPRLENGKPIFITNKSVYKEPYALIIDTGYNVIYSHTMGNRNGRVGLNNILKNSDGVDVAREARTRAKDKKRSKTEEYLRRSLLKGSLETDAQPFKRIFVTPYNFSGLHSLNYLVNQNEESWFKQSKEMFGVSDEPLNHFYNQIYAGKDKNNNDALFTYMPVAELNELRKMHESTANYSIVSSEDLLEAYSHAIRPYNKGKVRVKFYTYKSNTITQKEVGIYSKSGRLAGREYIERLLLKDNLKYTDTDYKLLPKKYNMDEVTFYNKVLKGEITLQDIKNTIDAKSYTPKKKYRRVNRHDIKAGVSNATYNQIKRECAVKGISVSQFILAAIKQYNGDLFNIDDTNTATNEVANNEMSEQELQDIVNQIMGDE